MHTSLVLAIWLVKIWDNLVSASCVDSLGFSNNLSDGFCNASVSSCAAIVAFLLADNPGILKLCGKKSTVSTSNSALVRIR